MNNIVKSIFLVGLLIFSACESLEEINIDPTRPTDVDLNLMLPEAITQTMFNQGANPARVAGIIMQQYLGFDAQQVAYTDYVLPDVTFNNYWRTGLYAGSLRSANLMIQKAETANAPHYAGIAKILLAAGYGDATAYFGDIPFSEALKGIDNLKPAYDTQEAVYAGVQSLLDAAITDLAQEAGAVAPSNDDLIFGGDAAKWTATAYALKARYLMHTIKRNSGAASTILNIIQNQAFQDAADEPTHTWGTAQIDNNPLAKFGVDRPNTLIIDGRFADRLDASADPRKASYMAPNDPDNVEYFAFYDNGADGTLHWAQNNSTIPLISLEELKFIEAELEMMAGNDDQAKDAMSDALGANMLRLGLATVENDSLVGTGADYIASVQTIFDAAGSMGAKHEIIINEAYVTYFGHAFHQSWVNYRRTGYPALTPSPNGTAGGLNPGGAIPRRYIYPLSESETNSANIEAAVSRQGGGLMNVHVWAFE